MNGYYKAELVRGPARSGPWKRVEDLELATLGWVHWHNTQRLHGYLDDVPPVEFENTFYAVQDDHNLPVGIKLGKASIKPSAVHHGHVVSLVYHRGQHRFAQPGRAAGRSGNSAVVWVNMRRGQIGSGHTNRGFTTTSSTPPAWGMSLIR